MSSMFRKLGNLVLIVSLAVGGFQPQAFAGVIGTDRAIAAEQHQARLAHVQSLLAREDMTAQLQKLGVDPVEVQERVAALTEDELARYSARIDSLPAGAGAIEVVGIVFIVLLILELVGVIDIFKAI